MKVTVDAGLCEANGFCMGITPVVFHLDDDDQLTVLQADVDRELADLAVEAARRCPRQAITVTP